MRLRAFRDWRWVGQAVNQDNEIVGDVYQDETTGELMSKSMKTGEEAMIRSSAELN